MSWQTLFLEIISDLTGSRSRCATDELNMHTNNARCSISTIYVLNDEIRDPLIRNSPCWLNIHHVQSRTSDRKHCFCTVASSLPSPTWNLSVWAVILWHRHLKVHVLGLLVPLVMFRCLFGLNCIKPFWRTNNMHHTKHLANCEKL